MLGLQKAERLLTGATMMTHAMVFTGVNTEVSFINVVYDVSHWLRSYYYIPRYDVNASLSCNFFHLQKVRQHNRTVTSGHTEI